MRPCARGYPGVVAVTRTTVDAVATETDAGPYGPWLDGMLVALRGEADADVACGTCIACCASSQFVHVAPDETDALAHIPSALLFPAPRMPAGHRVMGYDERGRCPMLGERGCTIYEHRPRTCRTYDCRVFPATGVPCDKPAVAERAARWRFRVDGDADAVARDALAAAAVWLRGHAGELGDDAPVTATQAAVLAVELHGVFARGAAPGTDDVRVELRRVRS